MIIILSSIIINQEPIKWAPELIHSFNAALLLVITLLLVNRSLFFVDLYILR